MINSTKSFIFEVLFVFSLIVTKERVLPSWKKELLLANAFACRMKDYLSFKDTTWFCSLAAIPFHKLNDLYPVKLLTISSTYRQQSK